MSAPAYESYKDSGVEWLGQVPSHWAVTSLRYLAECCDGQRIPLNAEQRSDRPGNVPYWGANSIMGYVDAALFDEELVLLGEDGAPFFDKTRQVSFYSQGPVWPNNHIHVLRPKSINGQYLTYALNATEYTQFIDGSTRDKLTQGAMLSIPIATPASHEQTAIAAFLDRETGKIDALIEAQTRLIELLKEKRQAVISHAVTKGLNPDAPMKDSGIEWLGQVPAHWDVKRLSYLFSTISSGTTPPSDNADYYDGEINWVTTGELREKPIRDTSKKVSQLAIQMFPTLKVYSPGTLLIAMYGATIGRLGWLEAPAATNQACCAFSDPLNIEPRYVYRYLQAVREAIILMATGGGQPNISQDKIRSLPTCSPPLDEQVQIADYLDKELSAYDDLEAETVKTISLLQERRAALISAAVTGKIDVRGLVNIESEAA